MKHNVIICERVGGKEKVIDTYQNVVNFPSFQKGDMVRIHDKIYSVVFIIRDLTDPTVTTTKVELRGDYHFNSINEAHPITRGEL